MTFCINVTIHFLPSDRNTAIFFVSQLSARLVSAIKNWWNWTFVTFEEWFSYSHSWSCQMVAYGEQKTKYVKLLIEKVVEVVNKNLISGRLRESFWNSIWMRNKMVMCGRSRQWEVLTMRELTVLPLFHPYLSPRALWSVGGHITSATQSRTQSLLAFWSVWQRQQSVVPLTVARD